MHFRVFMTGSGISEVARQFLENNHCTLAQGTPQDTPEELAAKIAAFDPHALIVRQGKITPDVQNAAPSLKVICKHGVGLDNIDVDHATSLGIPVMFTPGANFESVAEHTLALILALTRYIPFENTRVKQGTFDKKHYAGLELKGKTIGLIGYGPIARRLLQLLEPFGVNALVCRRSQQKIDLPAYARQVDSWNTLFEKSDIISLHCPLTPDTTGLINADNIARMKRGVYLINTARGAMIAEQALADALQTGHIAGAALDTLTTEPPPANHPLMKWDNVIITPHVGGSSDLSLTNMGMGAAKNILAVLRGEPIDTAAVKNKAVVN